jgi:predicted small lipoprotein YifL
MSVLLARIEFHFWSNAMKSLLRWMVLVFTAIAVASCGPADKLWPSDKIGPMWVNRYGHSNSQSIWEFCSDRMTITPGAQTTDCTVPWVDELFIGYGVRGLDAAQRDTLWAARTWELYIDGHEVDLPAFNVADFNMESDSELGGVIYAYRLWRIRLRKIPEGVHTLRYVMHVNQEVENDPQAQSPGTYELVVNFTFEGKK